MDNNNLSNDFEVRQATLVKLGGDPTNLSNIYEVDLAILEKTGQGGGGGGATIDDNTISTSKVWSSSKTHNEDVSIKNYVDGALVTEDASLRTWVGQQGFLTSHQSLAGYATETYVVTAIGVEDVSLKNYVDSQVGTINVSLNTIIGHSE